MDEARFEEIYELAMVEKNPARASSNLEFEIGTYLLKELDRGKIKDPNLREMLMWYKAYNALFDIENGNC